jgi:hypothetical protein
METYSKQRPSRMYKVVYENLKTHEQFTVYVESYSSYEAGESILDTLGEEFDLIIAKAAKPFELN